MKNKKGILMPEVLKILLAVICIAALVYLAAGMYGIFIKKNQIEQARGTLEQITAKINTLKEGETTTVLVLSPKDWFILTFNSAAPAKPKTCLGNCICICEDKGAEGCDAGGLCKAVDKSANIPNEYGYIQIDKAFNLIIGASAGGTAPICPTYADELSVDFCAWREIEGTGKFINCKDSRMGAIETTTVCNSGEKACAELAKAGNDVTKITINGVPCPAMDCTTKLGGVAVASADCVAPRVTLKGATGLAAGQVCCTPAAA